MIVLLLWIINVVLHLKYSHFDLEENLTRILNGFIERLFLLFCVLFKYGEEDQEE